MYKNEILAKHYGNVVPPVLRSHGGRKFNRM
nr:MAG TPA: hypothetical protein [Caudoviricetes sp.]